jgi:hypothetical protein
LAEALEDFGNFGETIATGVDLFEKLFDFGDDALLFG